MFFSEMPPIQTPEPTPLVRSAETAEVQALRREAATFLKELRGDVRVHLERRASIAAQGLLAAEADLAESRQEYGALSPLDYFSALGAILKRQVDLDLMRIKRFQEMRAVSSKNVEVLTQAERLIEEGRFAESLPLLKTIREATAYAFPSRDLIEKIQNAAERKKSK